MTKDLQFTCIDRALIEKAAALMELAKRKKVSFVTAESCTGGLIAAVLSEAPGAGDWLQGGFVTYTKENKVAALGVDPAMIDREGVVSEAVARAMAEGALARTPADISVSVTGVAGPKTDEDGTPVGTIHFAAARRGGETLHVHRNYGDIGRGECRYNAVEEALRLLERATAG